MLIKTVLSGLEVTDLLCRPIILGDIEDEFCGYFGWENSQVIFEKLNQALQIFQVRVEMVLKNKY